MKAKILYLIIFCSHPIRILTIQNDKYYTIIDGLFKNQTVQIIKEVELTKSLSLQENQVFNILLKRVADLENNQKMHCLNVLQQNYHENNKSELFEYLPQSIKQSPICLCIVDGQEEYIDKRFLKQLD